MNSPHAVCTHTYHSTIPGTLTCALCEVEHLQREIDRLRVKFSKEDELHWKTRKTLVKDLAAAKAAYNEVLDGYQAVTNPKPGDLCYVCGKKWETDANGLFHMCTMAVNL